MQTKVLVLAYGNPGRIDDGLGPAFAEELGGAKLAGVTVDVDYQLTVEDAAAIAENDYVIFADAAVRGEEPFSFKPVKPAMEISFSSHSIEPHALLAMAHTMFGAKTAGFALGIRGYEFDEFGERLSEKARLNLAAALRFTIELIRDNRFDKYAAVDSDNHADATSVVLEITQSDLN